MGRYSAGVSMSGINSANAAYSLLKSTTADRLAVVKVAVNIGVAPTTAPAFYLTRHTGTATATPTASLAGQPLDPADVASITVVEGATWATPPAFTAASRIDVGGLAVTAGGAYIWSFYDRPLMLSAANNTSGLILANANASGATLGTFWVSFTWDE